MSHHDQNRTIMFADVSGSSALYKDVGNIRAKSMVDKAVSQMRALTEANDGVVVKTIGDEVMASFNNAENACRAAIAIQQTCCHPQNDEGLAVRIGMDYGSTLLDNGDIFGDTVNDAACVSHIARANQTVITQALVDALPPELRETCQEFDRINIKGETQKTVIYRLQWESATQPFSATTVMSIGDITQQLNVKKLQLDFQQQQITITPSDTPFTIGRDKNRVNLHADSHLASRDHCRIEFRRGKYVLVDHSTNGTYVITPDQPEIYLRREELPLQGEGCISIGQSSEQAESAVIHYFL